MSGCVKPKGHDPPREALQKPRASGFFCRGLSSILVFDLSNFGSDYQRPELMHVPGATMRARMDPDLPVELRLRSRQTWPPLRFSRGRLGGNRPGTGVREQAVHPEVKKGGPRAGLDLLVIRAGSVETALQFAGVSASYVLA
jgi:hypothetical protein